MDNLKHLSPSQLLELWRAGKVSIIEAMHYVLHRLNHQQSTMPSKRIVCPHCHQAVRLKLTVHASKVDDNRPVSAPTD
ncbi:hypothetical protein QUF64_09750 [Anaerolineales bacterium HSG6]|nr:hypothetical protein [Anaerolineales bacterium HSG6]